MKKIIFLLVLLLSFNGINGYSQDISYPENLKLISNYLDLCTYNTEIMELSEDCESLDEQAEIYITKVVHTTWAIIIKSENKTETFIIQSYEETDENFWEWTLKKDEEYYYGFLNRTEECDVFYYYSKTKWDDDVKYIPFKIYGIDAYVKLDKQEDKDVKIGENTWMTKNLDVDEFRNGDKIYHAKTNTEWKQANEEGKAAWCYAENSTDNGEKYGKLYNWYAVTDPRGLAPEGWRVASDMEYHKIAHSLVEHNLYTLPVEKLKAKSGWEEIQGLDEGSGNGTNELGFSALPGGLRNPDGSFENVDFFGWFWSSTEFYGNQFDNTSLSMAFGIPIDNSKSVMTRRFNMRYGLSVRCIRED